MSPLARRTLTRSSYNFLHSPQKGASIAGALVPTCATYSDHSFPTSIYSKVSGASLSVVTPPDVSMAPVIIVPGNGGGNVRNANWYGWLEEQLEKHGHKPVLRDMPDSYTAR